MQRTLSQADAEMVMKMSKDNAEHVFVKTREKQKEKLTRCLQEEKKSRDGQGNEKRKGWVKNLSSHELTTDEQAILEKGFNFALSPKEIPRVEVIAAIEPTLREEADQTRAERARAAVASILRTAKVPRPNTSAKERRALVALQRNKNITILQADKGNVTVVMNSQEYQRKAEECLSKPPFARLEKDPTKRNEKRVNATLKALLATKEITRATYDYLRVSENGSRTPKFYGSAKIHKDGVPLRPIVSTVGSATYRIAKRLNTILTPYARDAESYIKNTTDFVGKLKDITIEDDEIMVSYDVKSLFTNVPIGAAYKEIEKAVRGDKDVKQRTGMGADAIMKLVELCLSITNFQFQDKHYELTDGLPMGSPASPVIANLFMRSFEEKALSTFQQKPKVWYRFVDDVFSIVKKTHANELLHHLNQQNTPSIRFTDESEKNGTLPFLDVGVTRIGGTLNITIYRKPTHSSRYLSFASQHENNAKRSVARALFDRVQHVTEEEEKRKEESRIEEELKLNGFPCEAIEQERKRKRRREEHQTHRNTDRVGQDNKTVTIPYIEGASQAIRRVLAPLGIHTAMRSTRMKWRVMKRVKDRESNDEIPGVVYAIGCAECKEVYIGETGRTAKQRIREHKADTRIGRIDKSAIAEHEHITGHRLHWEPKVIEREQHSGKRKVKEALHIHRMRKRSGSMNQDSGWHLSNIWLDLVD